MRPFRSMLSVALVLMALRINAHPFIARIRAVINANPGRTHIITVGGAHLVGVDALQNHLHLPLAMNGVVDASPN
jgi:hypothetical protein